MAQRLRIPETLQTRAAFEPATYSDEAGTVELVWTTGARGLRRSWDGPYWEELEVSEAAIDLARLNNGAPFLNAHDQYSGVAAVLAVVEKAWIKGNEGRALVRFSDREDVKPIRQDVKSGILRHVSVGYTVQKYEQIEKVDEVPVYRATKWTPYEISLVPIAFDDGAVVRSRQEPNLREVEVVTRSSQEQTMDPKTPETPAAPAAAQITEAEVRAAREAGELAERNRIAEITEIAGQARSLPETDVRALVREHTSAKTTPAEFRKVVLEKLAAQSEAVRTEQHITPVPGGDEREKFQRGAGAWLIEKAGATRTIELAGKTERRLAGVELNGGEFRGMSLVDLARECLERSGVNTRRMSTRAIVEQAFVYRIAGQTTSDFAVLFETALGKVLLGEYVNTPDTWSRFCKIDTVPDFRSSTRYRNGSFGALDTVAEGGEFKQKAIPDGSKTTISVQTKGNIIALTRQAIVNDDMSALADVAQRLGRAARMSIEQDVYALLATNSGLGPTMADSSPFFDDTLRANVSTTAAISVAAIDADRVKMASQKDTSSNDYLDLRPAVLLVHSGNESTARVINTSANDPTNSKLQIPNPVVGLFRDVVGSPRVPAGTGATTRRYIFADPAVAPAIVVAFLEGQGQGPVLESKDGWRIDGTEWKVRIDYKAQVFDPKGAITNAG